VLDYELSRQDILSPQAPTRDYPTRPNGSFTTAVKLFQPPFD
jgi:hypothetical protein